MRRLEGLKNSISIQKEHKTKRPNPYIYFSQALLSASSAGRRRWQLTTADLRRALVAAKAIGVPRGPLLEQWLLCGKFGEEGGEEGVSAAAAAVVVRAARSTAAAATALHEEAVEAVLRDELRSLQMQRDFLVKCRALDTDRALSKSTAQLSSMLSAKEKFSCPVRVYLLCANA